jgi:hydrogenase/urease accessory protein HupE
MALSLALIAAQVFADEVRPAYLELNAQSDNSFNIVWKQPVVENRRLPIDPIFPLDCELHETSPPELTGTALLKRWQTNCDLSQADIEIVGLRTSITDVMVRYIKADGTINTYMVQPADPILRLGSANTDSVGYLMIGIEHLIGGIDHVLFVIGLVLFIRSPWMLLKTITAFTVAHSITLALSILGIVSLPQAPVEAVIALSIVFLARELAQPGEQRSALTRSSPWLMAFAFGLLHGLGFAGVLREIGLPEDALFSSLLLFNVGIEIGQLIVVGALIFALWLWRKVTNGLSLSPRLLNSSAAYVMGSVAMYWTIDRTLLLF